MASTSGIKANGSGEYVKKMILKDREGYGPWKTKVIALLDAEEWWEIVNGTETEPGKVVRGVMLKCEENRNSRST